MTPKEIKYYKTTMEILIDEFDFLWDNYLQDWVKDYPDAKFTCNATHPNKNKYSATIYPNEEDFKTHYINFAIWNNEFENEATEKRFTDIVGFFTDFKYSITKELTQSIYFEYNNQ